MNKLEDVTFITAFLIYSVCFVSKDNHFDVYMDLKLIKS